MPVAELRSQAVSLMGHSLRGFDDEAPVFCEALKALSSFDDGHSQFRFQLLDRRGQSGLGHMAGLGCAREMALFGQGHQVFQLPAKHKFSLPRYYTLGAFAPQIGLLNGLYLWGQ